MNSMHHPSEEELIAWQMHESAEAEGVRRHLEQCGECAALAGSLAETLRVFSADAVPAVDLDRNWRRLRGQLGSLSPAPRRGFRLPPWPAAGLVAACAMLLIFFGMAGRARFRPMPDGRRQAAHTFVPLTTTPTDPEVANHLERAERLLTEVNHASGPLAETTRSQARELLLSNAVYVQTAHRRGDLGEAAVLEDLGRVLTNINHESTTPVGGWRVRFEVHTDGLLLELRILRQNDMRQNDMRQ